MNNDFIKIIGIDPGKNLGVSIYYINPFDFSIVNVQTQIYYLDKGIYTYNPIMDRINYLYSIITNIIDAVRPNAMAFELPFKHRFANAVIQLSQYAITIESAIVNFDPYIYIDKYPPKYIKSSIGAKGDADKNKMLKAVSSIPELSPFIRESITEHEVDAMAIAYILYNKIKNYPYILYMNRSTFNPFRR